MILYHRTDHADAILSVGFRNGEGTYMTEQVWRGVWLSDRPLDANEGAYGDAVLFVEIPEDAVAEYEWVQDIGYREFLVPAEVVNRYPVRAAATCEACGSEYGGECCWWCSNQQLTSLRSQLSAWRRSRVRFRRVETRGYFGSVGPQR